MSPSDEAMLANNCQAVDGTIVQVSLLVDAKSEWRRHKDIEKERERKRGKHETAGR